MFLGNVAGAYYVKYQTTLKTFNEFAKNEHKNLRMDFEIYQKNTRDYEFLKFVEFGYQARFPVFASILKHTYDICQKKKLNPYNFLPILHIESVFDPLAVSRNSSGFPIAYGVSQVNYNVWKDELDIDINRIFEVEYNIELGAEIFLRYLKEANGDLAKAYFWYNNGQSGRYLNYSYIDLIERSKFCKQEFRTTSTNIQPTQS